MNKQKIILMLSLTVFIISGFFYMRYIWTSNINKTSEEAIQTAVVLQKALDGEMLKKLRGIPADADTIEYTSIEKRLIEIKKVSAAARYIYFYTKREGKLYFIADSEPVDSANSSPPGQEYTEADIQYYKPFESGESLITRPSTDRWGTWVSILVPVKNHITGKTTAVFAMDYPAENWDNAAIFQTAQSGVAVIFLFLLIAAFYIIIQKNLIMKEEQNQKETLIKSLRASENRLSIMFESHSSIMLLVDPENGELINANPTACKFYGYSADQLRSMRISDLNMLSVEEIKREMREAVQHSRNYFIFPHRLSSGEIRTVEIHSSPVIIDEKPLLFSIIHDITERQKIEHDLRESENLQSLLLANLPAGVVIIDPATRIIEMVNNHVSVLFGATADQMVGRRCHSFLCPACEEKCPVADLGLTVDNADRVMLRSDGSPLPILKTVTKIKLNGQDKFLECFIDISDRKKIEEKLSASKHEADDLREKAEAASRSKSEFLASMSHEIRTPMNGVISMTGLLLGTPLTDEQKRFAGIIRSSGEALLSIINDILDFSKIEAYKLDLETVEFNLTKTVGETIELMEIKAEEKGLSLDFTIDEDVPEYLRGDSGRLRQILLNLLSNAIKFTASGSVKLGVVLEEDIGSWVRLCFTVTDTGIGIPADKLGKIFSPFTQADSSVTRKFGGTGLGLSISSNLVQLMGGEIKVESEYGKGSEFRFTAIFEKQSEILIKAETEKPVESVFITASQSNARILLAEDNYTNQIVAVEMLKKIGYNQVDIAANGLEVITALQGINYDLVLMDCHMPEMDGFEASNRIRDMQTGVLNPQIPVIAMTALAMTSDKDEAISAGMNDFLVKPVDLMDLAKMLEKWVSKIPEKSKEINKMNDIKNSSVPESSVDLSAQVFNKASFLSRLMNDENLVIRISKAFLDDMPKQIDTLLEHLDSEDAAAAGHQAHKIRGASANVGGEAMRDAASTMEIAGASGDIESLKKLMPKLQREFELLREAMENM